MSRRDIITLVKKATGMVVQTGLFSGLRLHDVQTWGAGEDIGPQLLGIYEQELHSTLSNFIGACPTTVINVGCAEGYYAVGLARLLPGACVFAFDCDPRAQEACRANAILNSVEQRVRIEGSCTPARLSDIAAEDPNILLITDCEGCEGTLFSNGGVANALRFANIIIEAHDYFDRSILPTLLRTFSTSHRASVVHSGPRNPHAFSFLDKCSDADKWLLVCENRPELQSWLVCERRVPPQSSAKVPVPKPGPDSTATNASVSRTAAATAVGLLNLQPLVYTVCYGDQVYFDCLSLMLQSLRLFGEYNDDVVVLTDRDESICRRSIDTSTSDKVHFLKVASPDWMTRYSVFDYLGPGDQSLLYIDTDIVIAQSLTPVLQKIDAKTALADIYVCSESAAHQALKGIPASRIDNRFANFFGLELFKNDADLSDCPLLLLNSGLFASTSRSAFKDIAARIRSSYSDGRWSNIAKEHKDQPFFNYAVAKSKLRIDTTFLTDATALLSSADGATRSPPLFAHFAWTWGESKPRAMSQYLTARSTNLPPAVAPSSVQSSREETVPTVVQPSKEDSGLPAEPAHKARKGLICDLDWITTYFVREHYHLVQLLQL